MPAIPLKVFVTPFAESGKSEGAQWDCDSAAAALKKANTIWSPAKIQFVIQDCPVDKALDMPKASRTDDERLLNVLSYRHPAGDGVNIFLVNRVQGLTAGGLSYLDSNPEAACFVQFYGSGEESGRALAHELGHLLSLDHVKIDYQKEAQAAHKLRNLMVEGMSTGVELTTGQIGDAQKSKLVKKFSH